MASIGIRISSAAPLCRGVASFMRSIFTLSFNEGLTPRAMRRRKAVSRLNAPSSLSAWRMAGAASVRESS